MFGTVTLEGINCRHEIDVSRGTRNRNHTGHQSGPGGGHLPKVGYRQKWAGWVAGL
jgi:hypothetical protein